MKEKDSFFRAVCSLAIPVALQSMLQSSFSIVDQIMIGQLSSVIVAGVGLAGKFAGIYNVVVAAFGAVAGIMISQYLGQKNRGEVKRSYYLNLVFALTFAGVFTFAALLMIYFINWFESSVKSEIAKKIIGWFSLLDRYSEFQSGILTVENIIYYLSFIFVFLFLTVRVIDKRRYS